MTTKSRADVIADTMKLTLDLTETAKMELRFLKNIHDRKIYYDPDVIKCAIYRYEECWLPLLRSNADLGLRKGPPLDVHWVWHVHMLSPTKYAEDCKRLHGAVFDHRLGAEESAKEEWEGAYPEEPFHLSSRDVEGRRDIWGKHSSNISYDLLGAALRQKVFFYQVRNFTGST